MGKAITLHPRTRIWRENGKVRVSIDGLTSTEKTIRLTIGESTEDGKLLLAEIFAHRLNSLADLHPDVVITERASSLGGLVIQCPGRQHPFDLWQDGGVVQLRVGPRASGTAEEFVSDAVLLSDIISEMGWREMGLSSDEPILRDLIMAISSVARSSVHGVTISLPTAGDVSLVEDEHYFCLVASPHTYEQTQELYRRIPDLHLMLVLDLRAPEWTGQGALMRSMVQERRHITVIGHLDEDHLMMKGAGHEVIARTTPEGSGRVVLSEATDHGEPLWVKGGAADWVRRTMGAVESIKDNPASYDFGEPKVETTLQKVQQLFADSRELSPAEFAAVLEQAGLLKD